MEFNNLGRSGLRISKVGLGCNNFGGRMDYQASKRVIDAALDVGVNFFDTADAYGQRGGSERFIGDALGERRRQVVLATKFGMPMDDELRLKGASRGYIMAALEASLRRLKTDYIDLYQLHEPDPLTPMEETLRALDDAVFQGKVRYIGCSNLSAWQIADAAWLSRTSGHAAFVSTQNEYSLLSREIEKDILPAAKAFGLGVLPYFPLASGLLTGKYKSDFPPPANTRFGQVPMLRERHGTRRAFAQLDRLTRFAADNGRTMLELAFSWLACQAGVASVIAGASHPEQVVQNAAAAHWRLSAEDLAQIDRLLAED